MNRFMKPERRPSPQTQGVVQSPSRKDLSSSTRRAEGLARFVATNLAGLAHGERPVVNGKAGVLSAQGSTPPSGIILGWSA